MNLKVQPPVVLRNLFPGTTWRIKNESDQVYLTFDDGPVEKETTWVLDLLDQYQIKASFFCVGENVQRQPALLDELLKRGHSVGNHSFNHLPAWKCSRQRYFENIFKAEDYIPKGLFRPPHGQLYPWYMSELKEKFSKIVMWDVLSMDYDQRLNAHEVVNNVVKYTRSGSIIVFHDSKKAWDRLHQALPASLDALLKKGFDFKKLEE